MGFLDPDGYIGIKRERSPWWRRAWQRIRPPKPKRLPIVGPRLTIDGRDFSEGLVGVEILEPGGWITDPDHAEALGLTVEARRMRLERLARGETFPWLVCTGCGCTDREACPEDCWWASTDPPLCSSCSPSIGDMGPGLL